MIVQVDVADYREIDTKDGVIMAVQSNDGMYPYNGAEYNDFCRDRDILQERKLAQDKRLYGGFQLDGGRNASVIDIAPSPLDTVTRLICAYMPSMQYVSGGGMRGGIGGLLSNGLAAASGAKLRSVVLAYPSVSSSTFMDATAEGIRDAIKVQCDEPSNTVEHLLIAVPYNTSLANWLHCELGCAPC